jgi:hypothetical protein
MSQAGVAGSAGGGGGGGIQNINNIPPDGLGEFGIIAGSNITIVPGVNAFTINAPSSFSKLAITPVVFIDSPYSVLPTDQFISVDAVGGAIIIKLANAPTTGQVFIIKDATGHAAAHNISITTVGGTVKIDAVTTYLLNQNYQSITVIFDGTNYEVF